MKRHHVYCTCCKYGKDWPRQLFEWQNGEFYFCHNAAPELPKQCANCHPYDPEDSRSPELRKNYKESLSGWWWLTKWEINDFFKYKMWRFWFK